MEILDSISISLLSRYRVLSYVSIYKQLKNLQNFFGFLFRVGHVKGLKKKRVSFQMSSRAT